MTASVTSVTGTWIATGSAILPTTAPGGAIPDRRIWMGTDWVTCVTIVPVIWTKTWTAYAMMKTTALTRPMVPTWAAVPPVRLAIPATAVCTMAVQPPAVGIYPNACPLADMDGDGDIDGMDLLLFSGFYESNNVRADLDGNHFIDREDVSGFAGKYGQ